MLNKLFYITFLLCCPNQIKASPITDLKLFYFGTFHLKLAISQSRKPTGYFDNRRLQLSYFIIYLNTI